MRVLNFDKTKELDSYDLTKGYLKEDKLLLIHYDAIQEQGHYETIATYSNGGTDVAWVVDVEGRDAFDTYEDIMVYIPYSEAELAANEITALKAKLNATDYQAIKYAEGALAAEDYETIRVQRQEWRARINELEGAL